MSTDPTVIVAGARTPMGRMSGSLKGFSGSDLGGFAIKGALEKAGVAPEDIAACFEPYRPEGWSAGRALDNLGAKLDDAQFVRDLDALIGELPEGYTIEDAAQVAHDVIAATG